MRLGCTSWTTAPRSDGSGVKEDDGILPTDGKPIATTRSELRVAEGQRLMARLDVVYENQDGPTRRVEEGWSADGRFRIGIYHRPDESFTFFIWDTETRKAAVDVDYIPSIKAEMT